MAPGNPVAAAGNLLPRIASSIVLIAIAALGAWRGGLATAVVVTAVAVIAHLEWTAITEGAQRAAIGFTTLVGIVMLIGGLGYLAVAGGIAVAAAVAAGITGPRPWRPVGIVYVSAFGLSLLALRASDHGLAAIALLFAVVWATDIGAYFAGRGLGGPKLWPAVSPKKTWSGAAGGLGAALIAGVATAGVIAIPIVPALVVVIVALSIAGQSGDLFESSIKRHFGAKDAGKLIPGHGGMMDRVDGLVFAGAVAVLIGFLHSGGTDAAKGLITW